MKTVLIFACLLMLYCEPLPPPKYYSGQIVCMKIDGSRVMILHRPTDYNGWVYFVRTAGQNVSGGGGLFSKPARMNNYPTVEVREYELCPCATQRSARSETEPE